MTCESERGGVSTLRARQTHLLHKNGAEWGSFIQEVLCLCSSVASRGTIGSQHVRPQEMKTTPRLTWHTKIKQIHIPSIYSHYPDKENRISFFLCSDQQPPVCWAWWNKCCVFPCCRLVRMDVQLLSFNSPPQPWPVSLHQSLKTSCAAWWQVPLKGGGERKRRLHLNMKQGIKLIKLPSQIICFL